MVPEELKYSKSHEWVRVEGDQVVIGITHYAQEQLSDVVYVELPEVGDTIDAGGTFGAAESTKHASDLYSPVGGEVVAINEALEASPELVNQSPYGEGWLVKLRVSDPAPLEDLLSSSEYQAHTAG